jgi:arginine decarboxylase
MTSQWTKTARDLARTPWKIEDSMELYNVQNWGKGYFGINKKGHLTLHPSKELDHYIDTKDLMDRLRQQDINTPVLLRVSDMLAHRLKEIHHAFSKAIQENNYGNRYSLIYPIKVNQGRHVVEEIINFGKPFQFGLEAGSKPELSAIIAYTDNLDTPIICNGFKDEHYIEMVLLARKMGKFIIPVVEKFSELLLIIRLSKKLKVEPIIGVRAKLSVPGSGRWKCSGGDRSKFGLTFAELLKVIHTLEEENMLSCLQLLHFHIGSQVPNIQNIKAALREATRIYVELSRMGAGMKYLDVGGGLGIDYDGSQTNFESSVNYTLQEYANDVMYWVGAICNEAGIPHPHILSESGRATVAYHSILIINTLGVLTFERTEVPKKFEEDVPQPIRDLLECYHNLSLKNALESFHDMLQAREEAQNLFNLGYLSLELRAFMDHLYWNFCWKLQSIFQNKDYVPEEFQNLEQQLADIYFCNYSLFQSMPDSWAIKQLFPIMPIHRLNEEPVCRATLADITCDSDGRVDQFIDLRDIKNTLELHPLRTGEEYYLGVFLVGAYQEILGDLHNLFGDTNVVHVRLGDENQVEIEKVVQGETVQDVLHYVQFEAESLYEKMKTQVEEAVASAKISAEDAENLLEFYQATLNGYTYLQEY